MIGRGMVNPEGWRVSVARVRVRVSIWLPLKNPYSCQGCQGYEYITFFGIYTTISTNFVYNSMKTH